MRALAGLCAALLIATLLVLPPAQACSTSGRESRAGTIVITEQDRNCHRVTFGPNSFSSEDSQERQTAVREEVSDTHVATVNGSTSSSFRQSATNFRTYGWGGSFVATDTRCSGAATNAWVGPTGTWVGREHNSCNGNTTTSTERSQWGFTDTFTGVNDSATGTRVGLVEWSSGEGNSSSFGDSRLRESRSNAVTVSNSRGNVIPGSGIILTRDNWEATTNGDHECQETTSAVVYVGGTYQSVGSAKGTCRRLAP